MTPTALFSASWRLFAPGAGQSAIIVASALLPASLLMALSYWVTGLTTQEAVNLAAREGSWARALVVIFAGLVARLAAVLSYAALVYATDARRAGRPLTPREAYGFAAERFLPFLMTVALALLWICAGLLFFVIPGLLYAARYAFAHLACLLEPLQGKAALRRSHDLVRSDYKRALGLLTAGTLVSVALDFSFSAVVSVVMGLAEGLGAQPPGLPGGLIQRFIVELFGGLVGAWLVAYSLLLYRSLAERAR